MRILEIGNYNSSDKNNQQQLSLICLSYQFPAKNNWFELVLNFCKLMSVHFPQCEIINEPTKNKFSLIFGSPHATCFVFSNSAQREE